MKPSLILLLNILCTVLAQQTAGQATGRWQSYLSYYNTTSVAEGSEYTFAIANGALYSYRKEDSSIRYYSIENGLNGTQITALAYNGQEKTFVIAYSDGNIDLITESHTIYNIPFLMSSSGVQDKTVNAIFTHGDYAYLCTGFGIITLDVKRREIKETYILSAAVSSVAILGDDIYATTSSGALKASVKDNLINPQNWQPFVHGIAEVAEADSVRRICVFGNELCLLIKNRGIYLRDGSGFRSLLSNASLRNMKTENGKLAAFSATELYIYSSAGQYDRGSISGISDISSFKDNAVFWLATGAGGLSAIERIAPNQYRTSVSIVNTDCPRYNYDAFMKMHNSSLYIAGGGRWGNRYQRPASVMIYSADSLTWHSLPDIRGAQDATAIAVDPVDDAHLFVSTWGEGVYEIRGEETVAHHSHTNSALASIYPTASYAGTYVRVEGVTFDRGGNLWMTNAEVASTIVVRKADGTWIGLAYPDIANAGLPDKILIDGRGHKWVNLVRGSKSGIFVLDDKGTIDDTSDDESHYYSYLADSQGDIGAREFTCIVEDLEGWIWFGTNRGPVYTSVPSRGATGAMSCQRIVITDGYGSADYFLKDERINAIAVDGGNRKWLGTEGSGLYLVSADGVEVIHHFTTGNSPLLSDRIESLAVNNATGELFIGTDKGLISYMGDATRGREDYSSVYAYPNPVRPEYDGAVVITGLMYDSTVKITDARGGLVFEGRSNGGQITWNRRNATGRPVAPGVYLVLSSSPGAKESVVTKIAVVK